jgi:hypothetical protein
LQPTTRKIISKPRRGGIPIAANIVVEHIFEMRPAGKKPEKKTGAKVGICYLHYSFAMVAKGERPENPSSCEGGRP